METWKFRKKLFSSHGSHDQQPDVATGENDKEEDDRKRHVFNNLSQLIHVGF